MVPQADRQHLYREQRGRNTTIWSREGKIYRVTPRRNDATNDTWMTDSGRELFKDIDSEDRLTEYTVHGVQQTADDAAAAAVELLQAGAHMWWPRHTARSKSNFSTS